MFFVVSTNSGRSTVLQASTLDALKTQCARLLMSPVSSVRIASGGLDVDEAAFLRFGGAAQDFVVVTATVIDAPAKPISGKGSGTVTAVATQPRDAPATATEAPPLTDASSAPQRAAQASASTPPPPQRTAESRASTASREAAARATEQTAAPVRAEESRASSTVIPAAPKTEPAVPAVSAEASRPPSTPLFPVDKLPDVGARLSASDTVSLREVTKFATFAALRLDVLCRISSDSECNGYLHFFRCDTGELVPSHVEYDAFRQQVLRGSATGDASAATQEKAVLKFRYDASPIQPSQTSSGTPRPPVLVPQEPPRSGTNGTPVVAVAGKVREQVRLLDRCGTLVGYVPLERQFPPSYWMLCQIASHITGIPTAHLDLHLCCDGIPELLAVQSDFDVRALVLLSETRDPFLIAVDLRP